MTSYYYFRKAVEWNWKMPARGWWPPESLMNLLGGIAVGIPPIRSNYSDWGCR